MSAKNIERQSHSIFHMRLMGAEVIRCIAAPPYPENSCNKALCDFSASDERVYYMYARYCRRSAPFSTIEREFQRMMGEETRAQMQEYKRRLPDELIAYVSDDSNTIDIFADFIDEPDVRLIGVKLDSLGIKIGQHSAVLKQGRIGIYFGMKSPTMQFAEGQIEESCSTPPDQISR